MKFDLVTSQTVVTLLFVATQLLTLTTKLLQMHSLLRFDTAKHLYFMIIILPCKLEFQTLGRVCIVIGSHTTSYFCHRFLAQLSFEIKETFSDARLESSCHERINNWIQNTVQIRDRP